LSIERLGEPVYAEKGSIELMQAKAMLYSYPVTLVWISWSVAVSVLFWLLACKIRLRTKLFRLVYWLHAGQQGAAGHRDLAAKGRILAPPYPRAADSVGKLSGSVELI